MEETETKQQKGNVTAAGNPGESRGAVRLPKERNGAGAHRGEISVNSP